MPRVRLLADAAGRYEVAKGELFDCTDEEFARWAPAGAVELADGSEPDGPVEVASEGEEPPEAKPPTRRRTKRSTG